MWCVCVSVCVSVCTHAHIYVVSLVHTCNYMCMYCVCYVVDDGCVHMCLMYSMHEDSIVCVYIMKEWVCACMHV